MKTGQPAEETGHPTEAECLLEQGAMYRARAGLAVVSEKPGVPGAPIFVGFKQGAFSIYFGDAPIYHFDLEGRWQRAFLDHMHYLKGLDGDVHALDRVREGKNLVLRRRRLGHAEAGDLDDRVRATALDLAGELGAGRLALKGPPPGKTQPLERERLVDFLEAIGRWDGAFWFAHRERYLATYGPLPFLPPDAPNAVVLQATLGHAHGRSFGGGPAAEHYVRSPEEFARHAREVANLWGRRLSQTRTIFLAGSDVLLRPPGDVTADLDTIRATFPIQPRSGGAPLSAPAAKPGANEWEIERIEGVSAFLDEFGPSRPDRAAWSAFQGHGLTRVGLGVESGAPAVRALYAKSWNNADLNSTIENIKAAGIGVSLLVLVGAGGPGHAARHVEETARLIGALELARGDFVFLLDEAEIQQAEGAAPGAASSWDRSDWFEQRGRLQGALAAEKGRGVKVLPYTFDKQWT